LIKSLGPPRVPKVTLAQSQGKIAASVAAAATAPINCEMLYPTQSTSPIFFFIFI